MNSGFLGQSLLGQAALGTQLADADGEIPDHPVFESQASSLGRCRLLVYRI